MGRFRSAVGAALGLAALLSAPGAGAQSRDLHRGQAQFEQARFGPARRSLERVLADGAATRAELLDAYRYLVTVTSAVGDAAAADRYTAAALALDPSATPTEGASPEITERFARVGAARHGVALHASLALAAPLYSRRAGTLRVAVAGAPAGLEGQYGLQCTSGGNTIAARDGALGDAQFDVTLTPVDTGTAIDCTATLTTRAGVVLERQALHQVARPEPLVVAAAQGPAPVPVTHGGPSALPVVLGVTGGVIVVGALVVGGILLFGQGQGSGQVNLGAPTLSP